MTTKRTRSMEIQAIKQRFGESLPPPPPEASIRDWFAGLALANPELMKDVLPAERALEAVRLADELSRALAAPRVPSQASLAPPTEAELAKWDEKVASEARQRKDTARPGKLVATNVVGRMQTKQFTVTLPPPPVPTPPDLVARMSSRSPLPEPSTYSSFHDAPEE